MSKVLKDVVIAVSGDFGRVHTHKMIKQWVDKNGGTFTEQIHEKVTHLICSEINYKNKVKAGTKS